MPSINCTLQSHKPLPLIKLLPWHQWCLQTCSFYLLQVLLAKLYLASDVQDLLNLRASKNVLCLRKINCWWQSRMMDTS